VLVLRHLDYPVDDLDDVEAHRNASDCSAVAKRSISLANLSAKDNREAISPPVWCFGVVVEESP
jgi:hypothetical protein